VKYRQLREEHLGGGFCEPPIAPVPACSVHIKSINIYTFLEESSARE
jgi:hypothetical protein